MHCDLTITGVYNVLEKLRSGEALNAKEKEIHEKGLVSVLKQIHDDLDVAVLEAYGWSDLAGREAGIPACLSSPDAGRNACLTAPSPAEALEQQLLCRLVALNHERAAEEKRGFIRWLRPDYQAPGAATAQQTEIGLTDDDNPQSTIRDPQSLPVWPAEMPAQVAAVRKLLPTIGQDPETGSAELAERLAACFGRKSQKRTAQIACILDTLKALGLIESASPISP